MYVYLHTWVGAPGPGSELIGWNDSLVRDFLLSRSKAVIVLAAASKTASQEVKYLLSLGLCVMVNVERYSNTTLYLRVCS